MTLESRIPYRALTELSPNPLNPRGPVESASVIDLAESIKAQGVLQPLLVTPEGLIVAGHRRFAAAQLAGLEAVPVVERIMTPAEQLAAMLTENMQRQDLTPLQEARAFRQLIEEERCTLADAARLTGVTLHQLNLRLAILKLDPAIQAMYGRCELPTTLAPALARVADPRQQIRFAQLSAQRRLPATKITELINRSLDDPPPARPTAPQPAPDEPTETTGISATRAALIAQLRSEPETTVSFLDLAAALEQACQWCGMEDHPAVCATCPVPKLIDRVVALA